MNWQKGLKIKVSQGINLDAYTTFKIGGKASFFACPDSREELKVLIKAAKRYKIPVLILGAGSNLLVSDKGVRALVIKLGAGGEFNKLSFKGDSIYSAGAVMLSRLVGVAQKRGLSGLEGLAGIPGTLGGALVMNASAWGYSISERIREVEVMDYNARIKIIRPDALNFGYRSSNLSKYIILGASFVLARDNPDEIKKRINLFIKQRRQSQDLKLPSAGCIFKNPPGDSAGRLIDACGLKSKKSGGAVISDKHANFILNFNGATAKDVVSLIKLIEKEVYNKFKVRLRPEIKIWH